MIVTSAPASNALSRCFGVPAATAQVRECMSFQRSNSSGHELRATSAGATTRKRARGSAACMMSMIAMLVSVLPRPGSMNRPQPRAGEANAFRANRIARRWYSCKGDPMPRRMRQA